MKQVILAAVVGAMMALTGCASAPDIQKVHLTPDEAKQIHDGKLLKPTSIISSEKLGEVKSISKVKLTQGVYVCATSFTKGDNSCYPHISALLAKRFSDNGVKIAHDSENADEVLNIGISFGHKIYTDMVDKPIMDELEASLANKEGKTVTLSEYHSDHSSLFSVAAVMVVGALLGTDPIQKAGAVSSATNTHESGSSSSVSFMFFIAEKPGKNKESVMSGKAYARSVIDYVGPRCNDAFPVLLDAALTDTTTNLFVN